MPQISDLAAHQVKHRASLEADQSLEDRATEARLAWLEVCLEAALQLLREQDRGQP